MTTRIKIWIRLLWVFVLCLIMGISFAKDPDESGVGGTGHKPKTIVDPDMLDDLDMPERVEVPEGTESFDSFGAEAADTAVPPTDDVAPADTGNK